MASVSNSNITSFMDICYNKNGFVLPAVHSRFVCSTVTEDMINEILKINSLRTVNAFEITKCFVEFLFRFKTAVSSILGFSFSRLFVRLVV